VNDGRTDLQIGHRKNRELEKRAVELFVVLMVFVGMLAGLGLMLQLNESEKSLQTAAWGLCVFVASAAVLYWVSHR